MKIVNSKLGTSSSPYVKGKIRRRNQINLMYERYKDKKIQRYKDIKIPKLKDADMKRHEEEKQMKGCKLPT